MNIFKNKRLEICAPKDASYLFKKLPKVRRSKINWSVFIFRDTYFLIHFNKETFFWPCDSQNFLANFLLTLKERVNNFHCQNSLEIINTYSYFFPRFVLLLIKSYLNQKMINSDNVVFPIQFKIFLFHRQVMYHSWYKVQAVFNWPTYHIPVKKWKNKSNYDELVDF